jgi:5-methylcytosine-specific restriction endonuclease McrA
MRGPLAAAWKNGRSLERARARHGAALTRWRAAVLARDGHRCQHCGTDQELHAHHLKTFADHPDLRFEVRNGLTLCIDCHGRVHGRDLRHWRPHRGNSSAGSSFL